MLLHLVHQNYFKNNLPHIDWQTNATYNGPQNAGSLKCLTQHILKDKGTLSFNISDVFNSNVSTKDNLIVVEPG
jgi:hypothetical protein